MRTLAAGIAIAGTLATASPAVAGPIFICPDLDPDTGRIVFQDGARSIRAAGGETELVKPCPDGTTSVLVTDYMLFRMRDLPVVRMPPSGLLRGRVSSRPVRLTATFQRRIETGPSLRLRWR